MQTEPNAKQQIVERIKSSTNILVTVGRNPSVDALSAALSLTLMLNRLDKHATAVFSGNVPPAINFLEPNKTFENSVDSLRDFIIALDKEKADRLRYKVEDDVVRIFITPYRTIISDKDLKFSQGDFNVELIIALGVETREDLDTAITAHGRILHDATVATINADGGKSSLGSVDWTDPAASSLCEMLMSLSEALQSGLLDQQIATAVLTGIVAATDRFRNEHTSPRVMTMAAQLMAAGANQQLIAAKLAEGNEPPKVETKDGSVNLSEGQSTKLSEPPADDKPAKKDDGALDIAHVPVADAQPLPDKAVEALKEAEEELAESLEKTAPAAPTLSVDDLKSDLQAAAADLDVAAASPVVPDDGVPQIIKREHRSWQSEPMDKPAFGGTLNATASDAEEAKHEEEIARQSQQLLKHDEEPEAQGQPEQPAPDTSAPSSDPVPPLPPLPTFDPAATPEPPTETQPLGSTSDDALHFEPTPINPVPSPTLADLDEQTRGKAAEDARAAVDAALGTMPFDPAGKPLESSGAAPIFDIDHDADSQSQTSPSSEPQVMPSMTPPLPPLPDFSTLPALPGEPQVTQPPASAPSEPEPAPFDISQIPTAPAPEEFQPPIPAPPADPAQFKIPGQP